MFIKKNQNAFTLVEMLIVIVIIGILSTSLIPKILWIQSRARDIARQAHIRDISNGLETYYTDHLSYPTGLGYSMNTNQYITSTWTVWLNDFQNQLRPYIKSLPLDPQNSRAYVYWYVYNAPNSYYRLYADYENKLNENRLLWYWDMDTMSGNKYRDMSGNGNDWIILSNPSSSVGKRGAWLSFDGNWKRLNINHFTWNVITISLWHKRDDSSSSTTWRTLLWNQTANIHHLIVNQSTRNIWIRDGWWRDFWYNVPNDNKYHHYVVIYRSWVDATLYVDWWNTYSNKILTTLNTITYPIWSIWNRTAWNYYAWPIDEVYIYDRELSISEIKDIYNQ